MFPVGNLLGQQTRSSQQVGRPKEKVGKPITFGSQISSYYSENGKAVYMGKGLTEVRNLNRRTQTGHAGSGKKRAKPHYKR
jgi:hypothetical protein